MTLKKRIIAAAAAAAALAGIAGAAPAAAQAPVMEPNTIAVYNGMQILAVDRQNEHMTKPWDEHFCTLGAVGNDKYGNSVGISAGHCFGQDDNPYSDTNIADDIAPIYARGQMDWKEGGNDLGHDPIGYIRYFQGTPADAAGHPGKDYAVIEFVDGVITSSQGPHINMVGINELPTGQINSPYATAPVQPNEKVIGSGIFSNNQLIVSGQLGVYYGRITNSSITGVVGTYQSHAAHEAGDSGGPAAMLAPGGQYPSSSNGYQTTGLWAGITKAKIISYPIYTYTSSANILADLRTRDIASGADGSVVGAGFQVSKYNHLTGVTLP